ncbi:MAG TPA: glycoside hydrolase, partial [Chryseosolibacter sp.]
SQMKDGDIAGLAVFQDPYAYIAVQKQNGEASVIMVNNGRTVAMNALTGNEIYLRATASNVSKKAWFEYSQDNKTFAKVGDELTMSFSLKVFTGNKFCLFNYATLDTGGWVDFDWFRVK